MTKHTPGEWKERIDNPIFNESPIPMPEYVIYGKDGKHLIASVWAKTKLGDKEAEANARLIAAAPVTLKMLEEILEIIDYEGEINNSADRVIEDMRNIIRKARGE